MRAQNSKASRLETSFAIYSKQYIFIIFKIISKDVLQNYTINFKWWWASFEISFFLFSLPKLPSTKHSHTYCTVHIWICTFILDPTWATWPSQTSNPRTSDQQHMDSTTELPLSHRPSYYIVLSKWYAWVSWNSITFWNKLHNSL